MGPLLGALLAGFGALVGSGIALGLQLPAAVVAALAAMGALLGAVPGVMVALLVPSPPSKADLAVEGLQRGEPVPQHPELQPLRDLQAQLEASTATEAKLRQSLAEAQKRAVTAEARAYGEKQRAGEATKVRGAFLTRMSHELRTPLNAVIGYAEMVSEEIDDPALQGDLTKIKRAGLHLKGLVTTVLDLTQLESGRFEVRPEPVDLARMAREVVEGARNEAETHQNTLDLDLPAHAIATVDPRMMQSILFNLVHNAVKYTARGTVTVRLALHDSVQLTVVDTGIGMTKQQLRHAFEPFVQGDGGTTRRYDGSGLGLAICKGFAEAMGGSVAAESEPGKGARITVKVPLVVQAQIPDDADDMDEPTMLLR